MMEAMAAAPVAVLMICDMCKGTDRSITVREISLLSRESLERLLPSMLS